MRRGFHLITEHVTRSVPQIRRVRVGLLNVFIQHTSASLTINENADSDVRVDFEMAKSSQHHEGARYTCKFAMTSVNPLRTI